MLKKKMSFNHMHLTKFKYNLSSDTLKLLGKKKATTLYCLLSKPDINSIMNKHLFILLPLLVI